MIEAPPPWKAKRAPPLTRRASALAPLLLLLLIVPALTLMILPILAEKQSAQKQQQHSAFQTPSLPPQCQQRILDTPLAALIQRIADSAARAKKYPTQPNNRKTRFNLPVGASAILFNQSVITSTYRNLEVTPCLRHPAKSLPELLERGFGSDSLAVRVYGVKAIVRNKYVLAKDFATSLLVGSGQGSMEVEIEGDILLDAIDISRISDPKIDNCRALFAITKLTVTGALEYEFVHPHAEALQPDEALGRAICYGDGESEVNDANDRSNSGEAAGLVGQLNAEISSRMGLLIHMSRAERSMEAEASKLAKSLGDGFESVLGDATATSGLSAASSEGIWATQIAPPPPPFSCDCSWTQSWACPNAEEPGSEGFATNDGSDCFQWCCCDCSWTSKWSCPQSPGHPRSPGTHGYAVDDGGPCFAYCCLEGDDRTGELILGGLLIGGAIAGGVALGGPAAVAAVAGG